jgi:hypothetical protein
MTQTILPTDEGAELKRLRREHVATEREARIILRRFGMDSRQFQRADARTNELWRRIRELDGTVGQHWMA